MAIRGLREKSARHTERKFVVEGHKCTAEALQSGWPILGLYSTAHSGCPESWQAAPVSSKEMERMSAFKSPPGILAVVGLPDYESPTGSEWAAQEGTAFGMVVDGLSDPGNLGTLIRTADWFGVEGIWLSPNVVDPFNPKVVQASMGAIFRVKLWRRELEGLFEEWAGTGVQTMGLAMDGEDVYAMPGVPGDPAKWVAVLGSESHGLTEVVAASCTMQVHIPGAGKTESLNATMAAGMVLGEWFARARGERG